MPLAGSDDHPPLFADMLRTVAEANPATPLIVEIKSRHEYTKPTWRTFAVPPWLH